MKYLFLLPFLLALVCKRESKLDDWRLFCPKCISETVRIELIDNTLNKHITDPMIIIIKSEKEIDTLDLEKDNTKFSKNGYLGRDTLICIIGEPGTYSFRIQTKEYEEILLENIVIKPAGDPRCKMAATEHFILNLQKRNAGKNYKSVNSIQNQYQDNCCGK
jgi:hypothetical protein